MEVADWVSLSDEDLLKKKISKLGLRIEGTPIEPLIHQLYDELAQKGLIFRPPCHMTLEVEGETPEWFMRLIGESRPTSLVLVQNWASEFAGATSKRP